MGRLRWGRFQARLLLCGLTFSICGGLNCPEAGQAPFDRPISGGNRPPRVTITKVTTPRGNNFAEEGDLVSIDFTAEDAEDAAILRVFVTLFPSPTSSQELDILTNFPVGPGSARGTAVWDTTGFVAGSYFVFAEINDRTFDPFTGTGNRPVRGTTTNPVVLAGPGTTPSNGAPTVEVVIPGIDVGVTNEDTLTIRFRVRDPNSDIDAIKLTYYFDRDLDPSNDATQPPIRLQDLDENIGAGTIPANQFLQLDRSFIIDLNRTPTRLESDEIGRPLPYFVRIRADDGKGGVTNGYALGAVRVLSSAVEVVDLLAVGGRIAGATFQGAGGVPTDASLGDHAGSSFAPLGDVDGDGFSDFAIVSEAARPFGVKAAGEVNVIYGRRRAINPNVPNSALFQGRYSGVISLNDVGTLIPGTRIFKVRGTKLTNSQFGGFPFGTLGIQSAAAMPDVTGDGRPELFVGAPFTSNKVTSDFHQLDGFIDNEDLDPCDDCTYSQTQRPRIRCFTDLEFLSGPTALTGSATGFNVDVPAGTWAPFDPTSPPPVITPNVIIGLQGRRILNLSFMRMLLSGRRVDGMGGSVHIDVVLEDNGGTSAGLDIVADPNGQFGGLDDVFWVIYPPNPSAPALPVDANDPVSPSIYDGRFSVFLKPSDVPVRFNSVRFEIAAVVGSPEDHLSQFVYTDPMPVPFASNPSCTQAQPPLPYNPLILNALVNPNLNLPPLNFPIRGGPICPPINRVVEPYSTFSVDDAPPEVGGFGVYKLFLDGLVCDEVSGLFSAGAFSLTDDDTLGIYESGLTFMAASDELVPTIGADGNWLQDGCTVHRLGQLGQDRLLGACNNGSKRGARFRGAWYSPDGVGPNNGAIGVGPVAGPYDPTSLFGHTVDSIPDLNSFLGTSELLISAPGGSEIITAATALPGLTGLYVNTPAPPTTRVTSFDVGQAFTRVTSASLAITGIAKNIPRLQVTANGAPEASSALWFWEGAAEPQAQADPGELLYRQFFSASAATPTDFPNYILRFANPLEMRFPVVPESAFLGIPDASSQFVTGAGTLALTILDDCVVKASEIFVSSAVLSITGNFAGRGQVWIMEGQDYSADDAISQNCRIHQIEPNGDQESGFDRPMSWPSVGCDRNRLVPFREYCFPKVQTWLEGEGPTDAFGWARSAGRVNGDAVADIACGAPLASSDPIVPDLANCPPLENGHAGFRTRNGKAFLIYGNSSMPRGMPCNFERLEIRGTHDNDEFGRVQGGAGNLNGDSRDDFFFAAESYDALGSIGGVQNRGSNAGFVGVIFGGQLSLTGERTITPEQVGTASFRGVKFIGGSAGARLGGGTPAKAAPLFYPVAEPNLAPLLPTIEKGQCGVRSAGDFNLDGFDDLLISAPGQSWPAASVQFMGALADGARLIIGGAVTTIFEFDFNNTVSPGNVPVRPAANTALACQEALLAAMKATGVNESANYAALTSRLDFPDPSPDVPTILFLARQPAGFSALSTSANMVATPSNRMGVAYLVFGRFGMDWNSPHGNGTYYLPEDLNRRVNGQRILKGIVFVSAYAGGTLDEAAIDAVSGVGDVDGDGFGDIILGAPTADLINISAPSQRRQAVGEAYLIYGNNFGLNAASAP